MLSVYVVVDQINVCRPNAVCRVRPSLFTMYIEYHRVGHAFRTLNHYMHWLVQPLSKKLDIIMANPNMSLTSTLPAYSVPSYDVIIKKSPTNRFRASSDLGQRTATVCQPIPVLTSIVAGVLPVVPGTGTRYNR